MKKILYQICGILMCLVLIANLSTALSLTTYAQETVTLEDLEKQIEGCSTFRKSCWTEKSWKKLKTAYDSAMTEKARSTHSAYNLKNAYNNLVDAKKALVHEGDVINCAYCTGESKAMNESSVVALSKVVYSDVSTRCFMDMYIPSERIGDCPLIIYIHGGGWTSGSNKDLTTTAKADCAKYGVATIAINYRYASEDVDAFDILDDIGNSLSKAKEVAKTYDLNLNKVMLFGISAGAHLSMLYAYSRADVSPIEPACVFEQSGPTDFTNPEYWNSYLGQEQVSDFFSWLSNETVTDADSQLAASGALLAISPVHYVNSKTVPTVICHGKRDIVVDYSEAENLVDAFERCGAPYELITFNANHSLPKDANMYAYSLERFSYCVDEYLYDSPAPEYHNYSVVKTVKKVPCTVDGYKLCYCSDCGRYYVADIDRAVHNVVEDKAYAPTCTNSGKTAGSHCSLCGEVLKAQQVIPATGHSLVDEIVTPSTYTSTGVEVTKCSICNEVFSTRTIPVLDPEYSLKQNSPLNMDSSKMYISKIPQGTSELGKYFDLNGCVVESSDKVIKTGSSIKIKTLTGNEVASYTAVVIGDITGDGYVDTFDTVIASEYINTFADISDDVKLLSADLCEDGYLDAADLAYMIYIANFEI